MFNQKNLWKICPNSTKMFNFDNKIKEKINTTNLDLIIKSGFNKTYTCTDWLEQFHCPFNDVKKHLLKIKKNIRNGFLVSKAQVNKFGRASYKGHISMALLPNEIRQALSIGVTKDYDIANCQPQILYQLCKLSKLKKSEYKHIKNYCENRNDFIENLASSYESVKKFANKQEAKKFYKVMIIATCFFGGSIQKYEEENNIKILNKKEGAGIKYSHLKIHQDLKSLKKEVENIVEKYIVTNNAQIYSNISSELEKQYVKDLKDFEKGKKIMLKPFKKNPKSRLASLFLQNWERIIIETVITKLVEQKKMIKNRFIYTYDGFQEDGDFTCHDLDDIVKKSTGIKCEFIIKGVEEGEELMLKCKDLIAEDMLDKKHPFSTLEEFDIEYFKGLKYDFSMMVDYWEKFFCFTVEDGNYWFSDMRTLKDPETGRIKKNRTTKPYKWSALKESFGHYKVMIKKEKIIKGELKIIQCELDFIDEWKKQGMRSYKQMDFYPENKPIKERLDAKYFNVFAGYPDFVFGEKSTNNIEKYKQVWEGLLINLLGNKQAMNHFNMIVSYKIKYPARKKPFGCIIKGIQGEGKNFVLSRIAKVIGESHYLTTSNVKDVIGDYAMGLFHKLIVNLNEMDLTSTKSLTNRFKSIVSENEITFNPKHSNQFEAINYALMILTTNEMLCIVLDIMTGERRWFIFEGNGINASISQQKWSAIYKMTDTDDFTKFLYNYYNDMECEKFDFKKAKRENSKSEAYNNVASLFIPYEMLFLKDWILDRGYEIYQSSCKIIDDNDHKKPNKVYHEFDSFYAHTEIEIKSLLQEFWQWSTENRISLGEKKNEKSFKGKIMSFNFKNMSTSQDSKTRRATIKFRPCDIMRQLIEKSAYDDDVTKWRKLNKLGTFKKEKVNNLNFLELL